MQQAGTEHSAPDNMQQNTNYNIASLSKMVPKSSIKKFKPDKDLEHFWQWRLIIIIIVHAGQPVPGEIFHLAAIVQRIIWDDQHPMSTRVREIYTKARAFYCVHKCKLMLSLKCKLMLMLSLTCKLMLSMNTDETASGEVYGSTAINRRRGSLGSTVVNGGRTVHSDTSTDIRSETRHAQHQHINST